MAIQYVGGRTAGFAGTTSAQTVSLGSLTGGDTGDTTPQAGDLVVVGYAVGSTVNRDLQINTPSGGAAYTLMGSELTVSDNFDVNLRVAYKFMGGTPDTQVELTATGGGTGNIADAGRYTIQVFRGVDPATPMDVAVVTASAANSSTVNPAAITPSTDGAWIGVVGAAASGTGSTMTASDLTDVIAGSTADTNDASILAGIKINWTSGSFDPAAFGSVPGGTTANSWAAVTYALRPALVLTQSSRFDNSATFHAPTVTRGAVTLTQSSRFDNSAAFYTPTVTQSGPQTLTQSARFDNSNTFHGPTVTRGAVTLTQAARFDNSAAFYGPTVTRGAVALTQGTRFDNSDAFYAPTVTRGAVTLTQSARFNNAAAFYVPTVTQGALTLRPSLFSNGNTFYTPTVTTGGVTVTQSSRFNNSATFYAPTVTRGPVALTPGLFSNSNAFYTPTVTTGSVTLTQASRFNNSSTIFAATVSQVTPQDLTQAARLDNSNTFYTLTLTAPLPSFSGGNVRIGLNGDGIDAGRIGLSVLDADVGIGNGTLNDVARVGAANAAAQQGRAGAAVLRTSKGRIGP